MRKTISTAFLMTASFSTHALNMAYVEVNDNHFANAGCYIDAQTKQPFFNMASIFAANINGDAPNHPVIYLNPQVKRTLASGQVEALHKKGIKVLVTLLGNHENAGWSCMTDEAAATKFANDVVAFVNKYQLDGIDIDDEYSKCATNNTSMIMMARAIKNHPSFKGKLLTKALFLDSMYFEATYKGKHLSDYLDYGWEMTYFNGDLMQRIRKYVQYGMKPSQLMIGGWAGRYYPDPYNIGKFSQPENTGGVMIYDVKNDSQPYLSQVLLGLSANKHDVVVEANCLKYYSK